jgi:hypothetical protein
MARFQLQDFVLLQCRYQFAPPDEEGQANESREGETEAPKPDEAQAESGGSGSSAEEWPGWPTEDVLKLDAALATDPPYYVLILEGRLDDPRLHFSLEFTVGARFERDHAEEEPAEPEVRSTLAFMAFPYVRELVASITGRSPTPSYFLPPRALPPDPRTTD